MALSSAVNADVQGTMGEQLFVGNRRGALCGLWDDAVFKITARLWSLT